MSNDLKPLTANDPVVVQAMKDAGIEPAKNGGQPKPVGSSKKVVMPKTTTTDAAPEKKKKLTVELSTAQEMRLLRESSNRQMTAKEYTQSIIDEHFQGQVGKAFVTGPSFGANGGKKITGPTNSFGREY